MNRNGLPDPFPAQFERMAATSPCATALIAGNEHLTYQELNVRANRLAHHLLDFESSVEVPVAIYLERSVDMIVAVLAVLKSGRAYLPLTVEEPTARLRFLLHDSTPQLLITTSRIADRLPQCAAAIVRLDTEAGRIAACPSSNTGIKVCLQSLAYCIYTSGSTGRPKGVQLPHAGIALLGRVQAEWIDIAPFDRVLQFASFGFDAFVFELVMALTTGAALVLRGDDVGEALVREMADKRVSIATLPPSLLSRTDLTRVGSLHTIVSAGENCRAAAMQSIPPGCRFINAYGPTETSIWATAYCRLDGEVRELPIGRPITGVQVYLLDEGLVPVPVGVAGEIHIAGSGLARGYLRRPALTAEKFVPNPFGALGSRMYRTGDLGRYLPDGNIEFLGRIDHQVKIRGFRIELGEIESALTRCDHVREAVVVARESEPGTKRLVAYVVTPDVRPTPAALRAQLQQFLPDHMLPAAWVFIDAFPLNASGKVDRTALPEPEDAALDDARAHAAPRTATEARLARIWASVLKIDGVGIDDNFYALGGDSLSAVQIANRIDEAFGIRLPSSRVLRTGTIARLAVEIDASADASAAGGGTERESCAPREAVTYPATSAQLQVQYFAELVPGNNAYQAQSATRIRGPLDILCLRQALRQMVSRHEHLRTSYALTAGGDLVGRVHPEDEPFLSFQDLGAADAEERLHREIARLTARTLDPSVLPLAEWTLFRLSDNDHVLLMLEHHFVHDGWSFRLFLSELAALYVAAAAGETPQLPSPTQFGEYAAYQKAWLSSEEAVRMRAQWTDNLAGATADIRLPFARPRPMERSLQGGQIRTRLDAEMTARIAALARRLDATPFQLMFAAFALLVGRYTGQWDFILGTSTANRDSKRWESVIGMMVNVVPVRIALQRDLDAHDAIARVRNALITATAMSELPFPEIVAAAGAPRGRDALPLVQIQFSAHNSLDRNVTIPGLDLDVMEALPNGSAKFDLAVTCIPGGRDRPTDLLFEYNSGLFDPASIERMIGHYCSILDAVVAEPAAAVHELELLDEAERRSLLTEWNGTAAAEPDNRPVHALFEEQAKRTPDATALVHGDRTLTFGELDGRANRLAHFLRERGVRPDARVALCVERGFDMIVALLAVLKAGGAFVPMDPSYPRQRLRYMLQDSQPVLLLVDSTTRAAFGDEALGVPLLDLCADAPRWAACPAGDLPGAAAGQHACDLAYVIYTSGSTGRPKGTMVEHAAIVNLWRGLDAAIFAGYDDLRCASINATLAFDASIQQLVQLLSGRALAIVPEAARRDANALLDYLDRHRVDIFDCTPSLLETLLAADADYGKRLPRVVLVGGEAISPALWDSLRRIPGVAFHNVYGPTECAVDTTTAAVQEAPNRLPVIGRPITGVQVYLLDEGLVPVPVGVAGEIHIAGSGLARGYLRRPALTAEKFVPNPFGALGSRMYRTGDLGRYLPDGNIEFLGRIDHQVKIRGFRIELGEIESALTRCDHVREAVVVARESEPGTKRLVAYVVTPDVRPTPAALRAQLQQFLPDHMLPAAWVFIDAFPLNASGKVDRTALPEPEDAALDDARAHAAPVGETAQEILALIRAMVPSGAIEADSDFFDAGLHSLHLMRLVAKCRTRFDVPLTIIEAVRAASARRLADIVESRRQAAPVPAQDRAH